MMRLRLARPGERAERGQLPERLEIRGRDRDRRELLRLEDLEDRGGDAGPNDHAAVGGEAREAGGGRADVIDPLADDFAPALEMLADWLAEAEAPIPDDIRRDFERLSSQIGTRLRRAHDAFRREVSRGQHR